MTTIATKRTDFTKIGKASVQFRDLIRRLLEHDPKKRLGGSELDAYEIKRHPFFQDIDWGEAATQEMEPPFVPDLRSMYDLKNIDTAFLREKPVDTPVE